ncbi:MAG: GNAT family N-acetyltransferase [Syntrophales bacterium]|nr:GNAT family N-acetyltransferase [Syntrophales bacterium]
MVTYTFIVNPSPDQTRQIIALYSLQGWWPREAADDDEVVARITAGSHCFLVAMEGGEIIGMGRAISDRTSDAYIQDVTVRQSLRSQGIGTNILRKIVARLQADGLQWIGLIAERGSSDFYHRLGFREMPEATPMLLNK